MRKQKASWVTERRGTYYVSPKKARRAIDRKGRAEGVKFSVEKAYDEGANPRALSAKSKVTKNKVAETTKRFGTKTNDRGM